MNNGELIALLSIAVTLLTSLFKTADLSAKQKNLIATGLSIVAGAASAYISGDVSASSLTASAVAVYGASQLAYSFVLKGTGLNDKLSSTVLFGANAKVVDELLADAAIVESVVNKAAKKTAKPAAKKTAANAKRTTK